MNFITIFLYHGTDKIKEEITINPDKITKIHKNSICILPEPKEKNYEVNIFFGEEKVSKRFDNETLADRFVEKFYSASGMKVNIILDSEED
jgi:hypothetical protein